MEKLTQHLRGGGLNGAAKYFIVMIVVSAEIRIDHLRKYEPRLSPSHVAR
jgi:hypothetical protein